MSAKRYRIVVRGRLSERFLTAFDGMTLEAAAGETVLSGEIADQSALYGLLDRLRDFGLELVSVDSEVRP
ncbi:MAG: hypothetical protein M3304_06440 [Actinomycetota bacterium]|nr:hypothetical protein [Actinomycetota bacterium]